MIVILSLLFYGTTSGMETTGRAILIAAAITIAVGGVELVMTDTWASKKQIIRSSLLHLSLPYLKIDIRGIL